GAGHGGGGGRHHRRRGWCGGGGHRRIGRVGDRDDRGARRLRGGPGGTVGAAGRRRAAGDRRGLTGRYLPRARGGGDVDHGEPEALRVRRKEEAVESRFWEAQDGRVFVGRLATG